jgi:hypothetical protein
MDKLVRGKEEAPYEAKNLGRNQVVVDETGEVA